MAGYSNKDDVSITIMHNDDIATQHFILLSDYIAMQDCSH